MDKAKTMTELELRTGLERGLFQCVVEAQGDGEICWDVKDTREREPIHQVKAKERFWCWNFKAKKDGTYTHDFANMAESDVQILTNVELKLVYLAESSDDPVLFNTELEKGPNWT